MPQSKERKAQIDLLNAYIELCPTQAARDAIREMCAEMHDAKEPDLALCRALCRRLLDGLAYGNWPSTLPTPTNKVRP